MINERIKGGARSPENKDGAVPNLSAHLAGVGPACAPTSPEGQSRELNGVGRADFCEVGVRPPYLWFESHRIACTEICFFINTPFLVRVTFALRVASLSPCSHHVR